MNKTIAIVHNAVQEPSLPDDQDVLVQVAAVSQALDRLGYLPRAIPCTLDLETVKQSLTRLSPWLVFNLVESLDGHGRLIHLVPGLLEALGMAYTGCPSQAIYTTSHKVMAKERMRAAGLPTPDWINPVPLDFPWTGGIKTGGVQAKDPKGIENPGPSRTWIIKSLWEHASLGLEPENLVRGTFQEVAALLEDRAEVLGGACFAEHYIHGREFNLSLLGTETGVRVLPPAEILFQGLDPAQPKVVGYRAKWMPDAFEYHNTPRSFEFPARDQALLTHLETLARDCWQAFGLRGYARVDFRVDDQNRPFILEINTNPCISPDAGFAAALDRAGISFDQGVEQILGQGFNPFI